LIFYYNDPMWKVTEDKNILFLFLTWHFTRAPGEIFKRLRSVFLFNWNYFSIPFLLRTFFAPWRRYKFSYGKGIDVGRFFEVLVFNTFSRFMGALIRLGVIIAGVLVQALILFLGVVIFLFWIILPAITVFGVIIAFQWII